jgi:sec-independent protein translocase protein TatA
MNIFGIGLPEMAIIFVVALLVFGPKKLPEIGRSLGKAIRSFQDASKEFETEFRRETERLEQAAQLNPTEIVASNPVAETNNAETNSVAVSTDGSHNSNSEGQS